MRAFQLNICVVHKYVLHRKQFIPASFVLRCCLLEKKQYKLLRKETTANWIQRQNDHFPITYIVRSVVLTISFDAFALYLFPLLQFGFQFSPYFNFTQKKKKGFGISLLYLYCSSKDAFPFVRRSLCTPDHFRRNGSKAQPNPFSLEWKWKLRRHADINRDL